MFRYFGSKATTASLVADIVLDGNPPTTVADAFGGLGNMGVEFKRRDCKVTTCDIMNFPNAFQHSRIVCQRMPQFSKVKKELGISSSNDLLQELNNMTRPSQWFVREYSNNRHFFTPENAKRISATWLAISRWNRLGWLSDSEKKYATASFLNSLDPCANTAGTYYAYLKNWDRKSLKPFSMSWLPIAPGKKAGIALKGDALSCLTGKTFDILYLDPPYNSRDYSRYYHLPETLAKLKASRIDSNSKSGQPIHRSTDGNYIRDAMKLPYLTSIINSVNWKRLVVQYADGAYIPKTTMLEMLNDFGSVKTYEVPTIGYRTTQGSRCQKHYVYVVDC